MSAAASGRLAGRGACARCLRAAAALRAAGDVAAAGLQGTRRLEPSRSPTTGVARRVVGVFHDATLNALEEQTDRVEPDAEGGGGAVRAGAGAGAIGASRPGMPQVGAGARSPRRDVANKPLAGPRRPRYRDFLLRADVSYEADVWGRVRRTIQASRRPRRRAPPTSRASASACTPSWRPIYFELRALDAEARSSSTRASPPTSGRSS